jgi:hypothetical protein
MASGKSLSASLREAGSVLEVCQRYGVKPSFRKGGFRRFVVAILFMFLFFAAVVAAVGTWFAVKVWNGWDQGDWVFQINNSEGFEDEMNQFSLGGRFLPKEESQTIIEDKRDVKHYKISNFKVIFPNGKLRFRWTKGDSLEWTCKLMGSVGAEGSAEAQDGLLVLDIGKAFGTKCDIKIPSGVSLAVEGVNGDLQIIQPTDSVEVQLTNGRVEIDDRSEVDKKFELSAINGRVHAFKSSNSATAKLIKVNVTNGMIGRFEAE